MVTKNGNAGDNTLEGTSAPDIIHGLGGDDTIQGYGGADTLYGDDGDDEIDGGASPDVIYGGAGADTIRGGYGDDDIYADDLDIIDGGAGYHDTVNFSTGVSRQNLKDADLIGVEKIFLNSAGTFNFSAQTEGFWIVGYTSKAQTIYGSAGHDIIWSYDGNDKIYAGENDNIDGGDGIDTVIFRSTVTRSELKDADLIEVENISVSGLFHFDFGAQTEGFNITTGNKVWSVKGGKGDDTITSRDRTIVDGQAGNNTVIYKSSVDRKDLTDDHLVNVQTVKINGAKSFDFSKQTEDLTIIGNAAAKSIKGGNGDDTIYANDTDRINGRGDTNGDRVVFRKDVDKNNLIDNHLVNVELITVKGAHNFNFASQTEAFKFKVAASALWVKGGTGNDVFFATQNTLIKGFDGVDTAVYSNDVTSAVLNDLQLQGTEKVWLRGAHTFDFSAQKETKLNIGSDVAAKTISGSQGTNLFTFDGTSATGLNTITNFSGAGGEGDRVKFATNEAAGTGIDTGGFAALAVGGDIQAADGFNFVTDPGSNKPASLSANDVAAFLADVNGLGTSSFQFANADNSVYIAATDGTDLGIYLAQSGNLDQVIDASELTQIAQLQNVTSISAADLFGFS
ncbi:MAG: hypothetical protein KDJ19_14285 [Hyphomicrobiaceae bacterium]|nr:hypothetical protein [Hyphomicrobiaceae bacterium]MCC0023953.1 hypothetical protein [Hyphomicrobiaceae bacterium]